MKAEPIAQWVPEEGEAMFVGDDDEFWAGEYENPADMYHFALSPHVHGADYTKQAMPYGPTLRR